MIRDSIRYWLNHPPTPSAFVPSATAGIFDGTYLDRRHGIAAFMVAPAYAVIAGEYGVCERPNDLGQFFLRLAGQGVCPMSVTTDGNLHVIRALRIVWPTVTLQRCLVHIQRQGLAWCRRFPKRTDAKRLRSLFLSLTGIMTDTHKNSWMTQLASWEARYGRRIAASRETGKVFSDLKRARCLVLQAVPDLFHYLEHPEIPRTTNALEGYFGRLKDRYRDHRGLARSHRTAYFAWYFTLCPR